MHRLSLLKMLYYGRLQIETSSELSGMNPMCHPQLQSTLRQACFLDALTYSLALIPGYSEQNPDFI
jgi:hypothetical protein